MSVTSILVQISSDKHLEKQDIVFFRAEEWSPESEAQLLRKIQELLSLVRKLTVKLEVVVDLKVNDVSAAVFWVNKKSRGEVEINNQRLSIREIEVLALIMQGFTNHEIAEKLFISYETVRSHRKNILEKTGAKNTAALINHYHQTFFEK